MNTPRVDPKDPVIQEKIRRGTHEYEAGDGVHGSYVARPYKREEYPKMMDTTTCPTRRQFKTDQEHNDAVEEWKRATTISIVRNRQEEQAWNAAHKKEAAKANTAS